MTKFVKMRTELDIVVLAMTDSCERELAIGVATQGGFVAANWEALGALPQRLLTVVGARENLIARGGS